MAKRNKLKGIAAGLLGTFISRNNDLNGYWALGVLYQEANENNSNELTIDLFAQTSSPPINCINEVCNRYQAFIYDQMARQGLETERLKQAHIEIEFNASQASYDDGELCQVRIVLTDDRGKQYFVKDKTYCWQHCPSKETQSLRAHE